MRDRYDTMIDMATIEERVIALLKANLADADGITPTTNILDMDSSAYRQELAIQAIENEYDIELPSAGIEAFSTVGELIKFIAEAKG
ncbi:acyl carrier protein [Nocardia amikacinitolerans]|nr:acyl carrier protein [Nocardia amikacinitolerans]